MANNVYPSFLTALWQHDIGTGVDAATMLVALIDAADETYNAADDFLDDVTAAGIVATSPALGSKTFGVVGVGAFDAANTTFTAVTGHECEAVIVYESTGNGATSHLAIWLDLIAPVLPNGGDIGLTIHASGLGAI
jgi:hypothetical protein